LAMKTALPPQESPPARVVVFAFAAVLPLLMHAKDRYNRPLLGGWILLGLAELGLLIGLALLIKTALRGEQRFDGLTFELPWLFELFFGGMGALILGVTLYATSIIGAFDLSYDAPKATAITPIAIAAALLFTGLGAALILIRPVFEFDETGARCTLFGTGLPAIVLQTPRAKLDVVAIERPLIDHARRITGVAIHIRGKAGALTFTLPSSAGIPRFLGPSELGRKDELLAAWRVHLTGRAVN
ncbi:MAG TPA: hypothetical protein VGD87_06070, partial [Archangium sp.]